MPTQKQATQKKQAMQKEHSSELAGKFDYGEQAGAGYGDQFSTDDMAIPMLSLLQTNSHAVKDEVPGASAGGIYNPVMQKVYPASHKKNQPGIIFQPCYRQHRYVEWVPYDDGGGLVAQYDKNDPVVTKAIRANNNSRFGKIPVNDGNELHETVYVYGHILDEEGETILGLAVIPFSSMKLKSLKEMTTALYTLQGNPPLFANRIRIQSVVDKKKDWYIYKISPFGETFADGLINPKDKLFQSGLDLAEAVAKGTAKADFSSAKNEPDIDEVDDEDPSF